MDQINFEYDMLYNRITGYHPCMFDNSEIVRLMDGFNDGDSVGLTENGNMVRIKPNHKSDRIKLEYLDYMEYIEHIKETNINNMPINNHSSIPIECYIIDDKSHIRNGKKKRNKQNEKKIIKQCRKKNKISKGDRYKRIAFETDNEPSAVWNSYINHINSQFMIEYNCYLNQINRKLTQCDSLCQCAYLCQYWKSILDVKDDYDSLRIFQSYVTCFNKMKILYCVCQYDDNFYTSDDMDEMEEQGIIQMRINNKNMSYDEYLSKPLCSDCMDVKEYTF